MILISAVISSSVLILVLLVLRRLLRGRISSGIIYGMWLLVALRLMMPLPEYLMGQLIGVEFPRLGSTFSVMNAAKQFLYLQEEERGGLQRETAEGEQPEGGGHAVPEKNKEAFQKQAAEEVAGQKNMHLQENVPEKKEGVLDENEKAPSEETGEDIDVRSVSDVTAFTVSVWLAGAVLLLCMQIAGERCLKRRLFENREEIFIQGQRVYKIKGVSTPLLFRGTGFSTDIYMPEEILDKKELTVHALLHEKVHQKHGDIWWGYLRNLLVAVYWFHPLVWVAAICSKRDCEYACDSTVVRCMSGEERISYGNSLLSLVQIDGKQRLFATATEMSMGGSEMRGRILMVKRGKKRNIIITALALAAMLGAGVCSFTYAKTERSAEEQPKVDEGARKGDNAQRKESLQQSEENLTMEELAECYQQKGFGKWSEGSISKYSNLTFQEDSESLSKNYTGRISYEGMDYQVSVSFDEKGAAEVVALENPETEDYRTLYYRTEYYEEYGVSPEEFVHHETILDERITYQLPEKLKATQDSYKLSMVGRLFYRDVKDRHGLFGMSDTILWSSEAGLVETNRLQYDERTKMLQMSLADYLGNGRYSAKTSAVREFQGGKLQSVSGCENITSLQGLLFTKDIIKDSIVWFDKKDAGDLSQKEMKKVLFSNKKLWIVSVMAEEEWKREVSVGYVFFLDAERYTKKQAVALARSISLIR